MPEGQLDIRDRRLPEFVGVAQPGCDRVRDETGVLADPSDQAGGQPGLEWKADEVEARLTFGDPAGMPGVPVGARHRE